jgi:hypothetical protein
VSLRESDEIAGRGAVAPRVTLDDIDNAVAEEYTFTAGAAIAALGLPTMAGSPTDILTVCVLVFKNGWTAVGTSACAHPDNFDAAKGIHFAREDAKRQMWPLMGYALRDRLASEDTDHGTRI